MPSVPMPAQPKSQLDKEYERYGQIKLLDVVFTVDKDLEEEIIAAKANEMNFYGKVS